MTGGGKETKLPKSGLAVKLDDFGIVADHGERAAEGSGGDFVPSKVDVFPSHWIEFGFTIVTVVEELPLRCY